MIDFLRKFSSLYQTFCRKIYFEKKVKQTELEITSDFYNKFRKKLRKPSHLLTTTELRNSDGLFINPDELQDFLLADTIKDFSICTTVASTIIWKKKTLLLTVWN